jgi:hypothetical protein
MISQKFEIGDSVLATPKPDDIFSHEFQGTIKGFREGGLITIEDQDGDCFDCDPDQIKPLED